MPHPIIEAAVARLAHQHGIVTRAPLRAEGIGGDLIGRRPDPARPPRVGQVVAVAPPNAYEMAACLLPIPPATSPRPAVTGTGS